MRHPYLVRILFGMPSLHLFTFIMFFKSLHKALQYTVYILMYISPLIGTSTTVHRVIHCIDWVYALWSLICDSMFFCLVPFSSSHDYRSQIAQQIKH